MDEDNTDALQAHVEAEKIRKKNISEAISEVELSINAALLVVGSWNDPLRRALLQARGDIRESIGEART